MIFIDDFHENFYNKHANDDIYKNVLFYTLGLCEDTRRNINRLYDFGDNCIVFDGLFAGWQTSGSLKVTRMAFNLWNGFTGNTYGEENDTTI